MTAYYNEIDPYAAQWLKNLLQVQQITKQSAQTLINWHRDKPQLFRVVIAGCVSLTPAEIADNERLEKLRNEQ